MASGQWPVANEQWQMGSGQLPMGSEEWLASSGWPLLTATPVPHLQLPITATVHLPLATCHLLLATRHLPLVTVHWSTGQLINWSTGKNRNTRKPSIDPLELLNPGCGITDV